MHEKRCMEIFFAVRPAATKVARSSFYPPSFGTEAFCMLILSCH